MFLNTALLKLGESSYRFLAIAYEGLTKSIEICLYRYQFSQKKSKFHFQVTYFFEMLLLTFRDPILYQISKDERNAV